MCERFFATHVEERAAPRRRAFFHHLNKSVSLSSVTSSKCLKEKKFQKKFLTVDHSAHMSMKDAAKCEN